MQQHPLIRVFLSSPIDVVEERGLAMQVLDQLNYDFQIRGKITIEVVAWDKPGDETPMSARLSPQEAINKGLLKPSNCEVVVVIFWSRMGTPLPDEFKRPDGSRYLSGTEWEYEDALYSPNQPEILVYRRSEKNLLDPDDVQFTEKYEQLKRVKKFFESFLNPDGSIKRGWNNYQTPEDFRELFERHAKKTVLKFLESPSQIKSVTRDGLSPKSLAFWKGSPFPGLRSFTKEDAPIFFGRGRETDLLVKRLGEPGCRFLAVLGASGSGKSSLIAAGLIPRLEMNAIKGSKNWVIVRFTPGQLGENPFLAMAKQLASLCQSTDSIEIEEMVHKLSISPGTINEVSEQILIHHPPWAQLVFIIDQFEESFTLVSPRYREKFIYTLNHIIHSERLRAIITLRADFYSNCAEWPLLLEIFQNRIYLLGAPGLSGLHEMIRRPAERAGLAFEEGLVERILEEVGTDPGGLALMAYLLDEMYYLCKDTKFLSIQAYESLGGIQGAIGMRGEEVFQKLDREARETLPQVFRELVSVDSKGIAIRRRAELREVLKNESIKRLVNRFTDARLFIQGGGEDNRPMIEVAHESLFRSWGHLRNWININQDFLFWRQRLSNVLDEWDRTGREPDTLLRGAPLIEAEQQFNERKDDLSSQEQEFIQTSLAQRDKERNTAIRVQRRMMKGMVGVVALLLIVGLTLSFYEATTQIREINGESFKALAQETSRVLDQVVSEELAKNRRIAADVRIIKALEKERDQLSSMDDNDAAILFSKNQVAWEVGDSVLIDDITNGELAKLLKRYYVETSVDTPKTTRSATRTLFLTDIRGRLLASINKDAAYHHKQEDWWQGAFNNGVGQLYIQNVFFDTRLSKYTFTISFPIMDSLRYQAIGVLHRAYDAAEFFAPSILPIRFGQTGHAMLIDSDGTVISCPILPAGVRLADQSLISLLTDAYPTWVSVPSDGHGGQDTTIVGVAPLSGTSRVTRSSTGKAWLMFIWQSFEEMQVPIQRLLVRNSVFGLLVLFVMVLLVRLTIKLIIKRDLSIPSVAGRWKWWRLVVVFLAGCFAKRLESGIITTRGNPFPHSDSCPFYNFHLVGL